MEKAAGIQISALRAVQCWTCTQTLLGAAVKASQASKAAC